MLKGKRKNKLGIIACGLALFTLASCSDEIKLPDDYETVLFPNIPTLADDNTVVQDTREDYYYNLISSYDDIYEETLNQILIEISHIAHDNKGGTDGSDVVNLINDNFDGSVADTDVADLPAVADADNQLYRSKDSLVDVAGNGTYEEDNLFMERLYVDALKTAFTLPVDPLEGWEEDPAGVLVTPELEFEDIYQGDYDAYLAYMEKYLYDDIRINYLVSEYIYTVSYASIGNANARNIQVIALTDRDDQPGAAKKLLDAYVNDYVFGDAGVDDDFTILSNLWKGITTDVINEFDEQGQYADRYDAVLLDDEQVSWLEDNNIIVTGSEDSTYTNYGTLSGEVLDDLADLEASASDFNKIDTDLESTYTGSYTYDYLTGVRRAIDDIATSDFVTDGIYLQSDGVSNLPDTISDRIFSTNMTVNANEIAEMKANPGTVKYDITTYGNDGYRYLTVENTVSSSTSSSDTISADDIIFYDSDSSTYYLVRILDVVNTQAMSTTSTTSVYSDATKREQIGREVAYVMSTTGSYKTEAVVYWLRRTEMDYSDEDFLDYMIENYPELFRTESPYDDEDTYPKITIPQD